MSGAADGRGFPNSMDNLFLRRHARCRPTSGRGPPPAVACRRHGDPRRGQPTTHWGRRAPILQKRCGRPVWQPGKPQPSSFDHSLRSSTRQRSKARVKARRPLAQSSACILVARARPRKILKPPCGGISRFFGHAAGHGALPPPSRAPRAPVPHRPAIPLAGRHQQLPVQLAATCLAPTAADRSQRAPGPSAGVVSPV